MSGHPAPSRKFQVFVAMLGALLLSSGFALMAGVGSASAADEECVPKDAVADSWTGWADDGEVVRTEENSPPEVEDADLEQYVAAGTVEEVVQEYIPPTAATDGHWDNTTLLNHEWNGGNIPAGQQPPLWDPDKGPPTLHKSWGVNQGNHNGVPHQQPPLVPYQTAKDNGNAAWFLWVGTWVPGSDGDPGQPEIKDTDYLWQKQVRELVPGSDAVTCEVVEPPVEPPVDEPMDDPVDQPVTGPTDSQVAGPKAPAEEPSGTTQQESVAGPTVPSKVDAGLTVGSTDTSAQGLGLAGAGVLLLAAAGVTAARKRTGDVDA